MIAKTFAEKIFGSNAGDFIYKKPDIILTRGNTKNVSSLLKNFENKNIENPEKLLVVLDHLESAAHSKNSEDYKYIRETIQQYGIEKFYDIGHGICHQIVAYYAQPAMFIVGMDKHTTTAGAFNAFATGLTRKEIEFLWEHEEMWFRVPSSVKIILNGKFNNNVFAKDLSLYLSGLLRNGAVAYKSVEFHGGGVKHLSISDRMTIANMISELGAKNAVFPSDEVLHKFLEKEVSGIWADEDAVYDNVIEIDLNKICPMLAVPDPIDPFRPVSEFKGTMLNHAVIGTCANGRIEDFRIVAKIFEGKKIHKDVHLQIIPASQMIYLLAMDEGLIQIFIRAGAEVLPPSCGPCSGTGYGAISEGLNIISTANNNAGNINNLNNIFLASPATVAYSCLEGYISDPRPVSQKDKINFPKSTEQIQKIENFRKAIYVWNYSDIDNIKAELILSAHHKYTANTLKKDNFLQHIFEDFDKHFAKSVKSGDILIAGENFGCGNAFQSQIDALKNTDILFILVKSVARDFFRLSVHAGLPVIISPEAVAAYDYGMPVTLYRDTQEINIGDNTFSYKPLPELKF